LEDNTGQQKKFFLLENKINEVFELHHRGKGKPRSEMQNINYENYEYVLFNENKHKVEYYKIHSKNMKYI